MFALLAAVAGIFGTFAFAMAYGQFQTRGVTAPGARIPD